jgi:hypothetical protein
MIFSIENLTSKTKLNWFLYKNHEAESALGTPLVIFL